VEVELDSQPSHVIETSVDTCRGVVIELHPFSKQPREFTDTCKGIDVELHNFSTQPRYKKFYGQM